MSTRGRFSSSCWLAILAALSGCGTGAAQQTASNSLRFPPRDVKFGREPSGASGERRVIHRGMEKAMDGFRWCYDQHLSSDSSLEGTALLEFVVHPDGAVTDAVAHFKGEAEIEKCLADRVRTIRFDRTPRDVLVEYPLLFRMDTD